MRVLLLLRGSPGCGKSTWIEQNGLKQYTLSSDDIRLMCSSPVLNVDGEEEISQSNDKVVWDTLFKLLEIRMQNGEFTVIDATNSKTVEMNRYKELCVQHKYRIYCVDFTGIPIEVAKERNKNRTELKRVPDEVIDRMYARFQTQKIPSGITVIKPDELDRVWLHKIDLSEYQKVHIIGDIHGCHTAFKNYIDGCGGFNDNEFYIFCGDYIDRGIENAEMVSELLRLYEKKNVCLLEGNHERWMWIWANGGIAQSREFELVTKTQLENAEIDKKSVRKLYRKIGQCAYFVYCGNEYLVTHGGLSKIPENMTFVSTTQMIKGVGKYDEFETVADSFVKNTQQNCYQIHGHRNPKGLPVRENDRCFNLEGRVEFGEYLRCVQLLPDGSQIAVETKNDVFNKPPEYTERAMLENKSVGDVIVELRNNRYVQEKRFGDISSFNFTKSAFYNRVWDEQTIKARGLYINIPKQKVVARAYNKFFNINERPETRLEMLQDKLSFPVTAYVKENGFLGIVSCVDDQLFVTTKSNPDGDYAKWFRNILESSVSCEILEEIKNYSRENNVSFVFECVDMVNDPHIIEYDGNRLFLLDIIYNDIEYKKYEFKKLCEVADRFGLTHKEKAYEIETWQDFFDWYYYVTDEDYKYKNRKIEGFVIEDSSGYMTKLKLAYYNFWKFMRSISHEAIKNGYIIKTSSLTTPLANQYYSWVRTLHDIKDIDLLPKDICSLRKLFYATDIGKQFAAEE